MESPGYMLGLPSRGHVPVPGVVAVCERDDGSIWLVDAGWSAEVCSHPRSAGVLQRRALGVKVRPGDDMRSQLERAGLDPAAVTAIIATHLHLDHVGGACDFPNAELIATHDEVAEAYRASWLKGYRRADIDSVDRLRLMKLEPAPSMGFSRSLVLDDEISLLDTRGHSAGHTAVAIRDGARTWIHAGDAAYVKHEIEAQLLSPLSRLMAYDPAAAKVAQRRLHACMRQAPSVTVVLSHDARAFSALPKL
jgi:glyoxylase-like metal-dependent hydrolase (beta-lactamase superfamily II)